MRGNSLTLLGKEIKVGDKAPDVALLDNDLKPVKLSSFLGKVVVVSSVPSLDTPTCDMETRRFNMEAAKLSEAVVILTVSTDLPFAQKRWCGAAGVEKVKTLSDHRETAFGLSFGVFSVNNPVLGSPEAKRDGGYDAEAETNEEPQKGHHQRKRQ